MSKIVEGNGRFHGASRCLRVCNTAVTLLVSSGSQGRALRPANSRNSISVTSPFVFIRADLSKGLSAEINSSRLVRIFLAASTVAKETRQLGPKTISWAKDEPAAASINTMLALTNILCAVIVPSGWVVKPHPPPSPSRFIANCRDRPLFGVQAIFVLIDESLWQPRQPSRSGLNLESIYSLIDSNPFPLIFRDLPEVDHEVICNGWHFSLPANYL